MHAQNREEQDCTLDGGYAAGELMGIPGASQGGPGDVEEYLAQARGGHPGPLPREFSEFERIYQGVQPGRPMGEGLPAGPMSGLPGLTPSLHVRLPDLSSNCRDAT